MASFIIDSVYATGTDRAIATWGFLRGWDARNEEIARLEALLDRAEVALEKVKSMNFVHVVDLKNWEHQSIAKEALEEIRKGRGK